ncbi:MAG: PEP-CTERM sorting domain-containing protein [Chthoniobacter sp.]|nr:PEP-CTERM sorting domain-containing protein [Chthoniobacter sp.]
MKLCHLFFLPIALLPLVTTPAGRAATVYSGPLSIPVPLNLEGLYLNLTSGVATGSYPADWNTAPWINPFFGGVDIASSTLLRPVITGADQIVSLPGGTSIGTGNNFALGESGSSTHVGAGAGQFTLGIPGYLGFAMQAAPASPIYYGWLQIEIHNTGPGTVLGWAYQDTPDTPIPAGLVPEPAGAALFFLGLGLLGLGRRRN